MTNSSPHRCPSSECKPGAVLVGVVTPGGVSYLKEQVTVDEEFVRIANEGRAPERRFRFSSPCAEGACGQWDGTGCGVVNNLLASFAPKPKVVDLPDCSIRTECRWFHQRGLAACAMCPEVVTDTTEAGVGLPPRVAVARSHRSGLSAEQA